jgi:predicted amidohydrolase
MLPEKYQKYEKTVTLACVNFQTVWGDKAANLEKMKGTVATAARFGNNIIVFPELALSGYDCGPPPCTHHKDTAETIPGPATEEMAKVAKDNGVYVIFGMPERDKEKPDTLYISSPLIGPEGLIGNYRKIHIAGPPLFKETDCFVGGNELPVFETRYGPIGIQICYDFWFFSELTKILALKGARLIINTTASPSGPAKEYFIVQETGNRATENTVFAGSANLVGKERVTNYYGHSCIAGPDVPRLTKIYAEGGGAEEIVTATLNFERLHIFQAAAHWAKDRRSDLILREMQDLAK